MSDRCVAKVRDENLWRVECDGTGASLIDGRVERAVPVADAVDAPLHLIAENAAPLGCSSQVAHAEVVVRTGSIASGQIAARAAALGSGASNGAALKSVTDRLAAEPSRRFDRS